MARTKGNITKLQTARTKTDSIRATVPSFIVQSYGLSKNDSLEWKIENLDNGLIRVKVIRGKGE